MDKSDDNTKPLGRGTVYEAREGARTGRTARWKKSQSGTGGETEEDGVGQGSSWQVAVGCNTTSQAMNGTSFTIFCDWKK